LAIRESLLHADPGNPLRMAELSGTYWKLGICLNAASDFSGALTNLRKALAFTEQSGLANSDADAKDRLAGDYWAIGGVLLSMRNYAESLESYRKGAAIRDSIAPRDSTQEKALQTHLAGDYFGMSQALMFQGQPSSAQEAATKSLNILLR